MAQTVGLNLTMRLALALYGLLIVIVAGSVCVCVLGQRVHHVVLSFEICFPSCRYARFTLLSSIFSSSSAEQLPGVANQINH